MLRLGTIYRNYRNVRTKLISRTLDFGASTVLITASMGSGLPLLITQAASALSASDVYVSTSGTGDCSSMANACNSFATALAAVDTNGTIHVAAGTYMQALTITKSVKILGSGTGTTKIVAPNNLPSEGAIVDISGASTDVNISKLTVAGPGPSGCGSIMSGVYVEGSANADLHDMAVTDIRDNPLSGCQNGRAILVGWAHGWGIPNSTGTATIQNVTINDYQKAGVEVSGAGSSATIKNNTITGVGPTSLIAANGVEVTYGATATITGNTITDNDYTPASDIATGILLYQPGGTTVKNNTVTSNGVGLSTDSQASVGDNMNVNKITGNRIDNAVADTTGWTTPSTVYADSSAAGTTDGNGSTIIMTQGSAHVWNYDLFSSIQTAINAAPINGTIKIADGTYHEDLSFSKNHTTLVGQNEAGVNIDTTAGYGVDIEHQDNLELSNLTFNSSPANSYALHAYGANSLSLTDLAFNGPGKTSHTGGVDVNSSQNVYYRNVSVSNYGKNGLSVTAQYAPTDTYSSNFTFENITSSDNGWDGVAFYTTNSAGTVGHSITGVQFTGTNNITNNGNGGNPTQGGIFIEGDNDLSSFFCIVVGNCIPQYTVSTSHNTLQLGDTNFSGNTSDIVNFQTAHVNALDATFAGKTGDQMTTSERTTEDGLIFDKLDRSALGLVRYYDKPTVPTNGQPNGGFEKTNNFYFTWDKSSGDGPITYEYQTSMNPASSNGVLTTGIWDNITNGNSQQKHLTSPEIISVGAPDGAWYWQVRAIDANGSKSAWSSIWSVTIDAHAPTGLANVSPANGTWTTTAKLTQVNWTAATDPYGPVTYFYEISNSPATNPNGSFKNPVYQSGVLLTNSINTPNTPAGTYYWHVRAVGASGNSTPWTGAWKLTVDNTPPAVPSSALKDSNGKSITNGYINTKHFTFNLSDSSNDVTRYQLKYWNNIPGSPFNGENNAWNPTDLSGYSSSLGVYNDQFTQGEGTHYFAFSACDAAGNCSAYSAPFTVVYDKTSPAVAITKPTDFSKPFSVGPPVTVTATDTGSGLRSLATDVYDSTNTLLTVCGNATANELSIGSMNCDLSSLPNGTYSLVASATDNAGNSTTLPATTFTVSKVTPVIHTAVTFNTVHNNSGTTPSQGQNTNTQTTNTTGSNNNDNGHVKGASTTTPNTVASSTNQPTNTKNVASKFFGLAWYWWVLIILAVLAFVFGVYRRASTDNTNN